MRTHTLEVWRVIVGYEGWYEVSNLARVRSVERDVISTRNGKQYVKHLKEKILRAAPDSDGYLQVGLYKDGVKEEKKVHQLVAEAFIENLNNYTHVHHINHINTDNRIENLEWISKEEHDRLHADERAKVVYQYTLDGLLVNVWKSAAEAARVLGFIKVDIINCCNGKQKTHKGYKWSYVPL